MRKRRKDAKIDVGRGERREAFADEEIDQPVGVPVSAEADAQRMFCSGSGCRLRRRRNQLCAGRGSLAASYAADIEAIGQAASSAGIAISGVCSFLYWPYSLTANDPERRKKGLELAGKMIEAASLLGTENLLVVPGAVYIPWLKEMEPVANAACYERSRAAVEKLLPQAEKHRVFLNLENIFANAFLMSPQEMVEFVDSFKHERVKIHFDTGNIMQYQFPQHWIPVLGRRIKNIHFKEFNQRSGEFNLEAFRPLLDGTTDWPAVIAALEQTGYDGYLTFEYFHPFQHWPEALIYQTSAALDRMLGKTVKHKIA